MNILHVVFGESAAGTLRMILRGRNSADQSVSLADSLEFGPVRTGSWADRIRWLDQQVPDHLGWDRVAQSAARFLQTVKAWKGDRLVWIAPRSASEQCGLQWYFEQAPDAPTGPMIIADKPLSRGWRDEPPLSLGELPAELMNELLDHAPRREWPTHRASPREWQRLRAEDTLLRIVEDGELRSVAEDRFDGLFLKHVSDEWQKWPRVVGNAMVDVMGLGHHTSDAFYIWRLRELVRQGRIACRGELPDRHHDAQHRPNASLRRIS